MRHFILFIAVCALGFLSCVSQEEPQLPVRAEPVIQDLPADPPPAEPVPAEPAPAKPEPAPPVFDYSSVTEEDRNTAKTDIRELINELNGIIRRGDFN
ncbi:MAG: hypothetical protein LBO76_05850, partial [Treponema sp.]|nr:hypothetical protein [Treponema sp.]